MARHIMAVCVVCLLCADRLPCQQHFHEINSSQSDLNPAYAEGKAGTLSPRGDTSTNPSMQPTHHRSQGNYKEHDNIDLEKDANAIADQNHRQKRHTTHTPSSPYSHNRITEQYIHRLFDSFNSANEIMSTDNFQHLLRQLGLNLYMNKSNNSCISDKVLVQLVQPHDSAHHHHSSSEKHLLKVQLNGEETQGVNYTLNAQDMLNICPVLLYQLTSSSNATRAGCIDASTLSITDGYEADLENTVQVWIYAFISVFACSILGLVGVAIIPFMDSRYYKHIIQFLVSLAVGTMTGDAVLHLLPHALVGQNEKNMVYKGLTCMGGIIFFYITEHGLTMISEWRKSIAKKERKKPSRVKVMREPDSALNSSVTGDKLCKSKYSSYPYCYDEIAMDTKNDVWMHLPTKNVADAQDNCSDADRKKNGNTEVETGEMAAQSLLSTSQNNYAPVAEMNFRSQQNQQHLPGSNTISTDLDGNSVNDGIVVDNAANGNNTLKEKVLVNDTVTVILREHESSHHGHSHKHGHVHSPPESLSAVAWMIIMGDGLHNFTDGMAIGAAFADNIAGGFSTSLAVFCHELPHELGDFAILMKAGMSVKSAVYYNLLTGVLSFIGMIFGIVFGQSQEAAQWMFAAAAGLFIYIALVDMMPELSAAHKSLEQFVLQIVGMISGVFLMLLIAMYEDDLMNVFSTNPIH